MEEIRNLIHTRKPGVDEVDIKAAEEKLGAIFPEQYRELFKLVNNAEIDEWILYPVRDHRNPKKTWDDVVRQNIEVRDEAMGADLVVIGDDGSGDKLCLRNDNGIMGDFIYLWYHEDLEIEELAPNIKEFILSLSDE